MGGEGGIGRAVVLSPSSAKNLPNLSRFGIFQSFFILSETRMGRKEEEWPQINALSNISD
jgi:hypothetical protein